MSPAKSWSNDGSVHAQIHAEIYMPSSESMVQYNMHCMLLYSAHENNLPPSPPKKTQIKLLLHSRKFC